MHPLFGLHKYSASVDERQWMPYFLHRGIQFHTFAPYTLPRQMPFCQAAILLPSVTTQQKKKNAVGYWWEASTSTSIPSTSTSDVLGHHEVEGITFGAALIILMGKKSLKDSITGGSVSIRSTVTL